MVLVPDGLSQSHVRTECGYAHTIRRADMELHATFGGGQHRLCGMWDAFATTVGNQVGWPGTSPFARVHTTYADSNRLASAIVLGCGWISVSRSASARIPCAPSDGIDMDPLTMCTRR